MPQFTVRVELHEAKWGDYDTLHAAMAKKGFSRVIVADDRRTFHLPWAEYDGAADLTSMQVLEIAKIAAKETGRRNAILVTESKSRAWFGLQPAST